MRALRAAKGPLLMLDTDSLLDIGSCIIDGVDIAPGKAIPDDGDPRIYRALEGFIFTCGPDHIRHPVPVPGNAHGALYPLHGSFSSHPAEIVSWENDSAGGVAHAAATAAVKLADGGEALLERRWEIDGVSGEVSLSDRVTNTGESPFPVFMMYHINIAGRLVLPDAMLEGEMLEAGGFPWRFGSENSGVFCVPAATDGMARVSLGPVSAPDGKTLTVAFSTDTLPFLQVWRNQKTPCDVIGIEPVSHRLAKRSELEDADEFDILSPGEGRSYSLSFHIS